KARNIQNQTLERLEDILVRMGFMNESEVLDLWAEFLGVSLIDLTNIKIDAKTLSLIPEYLAKQYKVIPFKKVGNKLTLVMADPFDIMATDMIAFLTQCKLEILIAPKNQVDLSIRQLYSWEGFSVAGEDSLIDGDGSVDVARRTSEEGPVVQFLNAIFKQAILKRASDIHVEPREDLLLIRFRVDGNLHDAMTGPKSLIAPLISRIKILSHLDIAEKRMPQDGRLKVKMEGTEIDFRVSTVPSFWGEKAVLRLLQREAAFDLDNLGFLPEDLDRLKSVLDEPYGMILVTGPTGAGKTTTLFGMLKYFSSSEINIFTIENPIEYRIDGITQVQTNEKVGLDFAQGLRAALRQDPDIILVGEIRDLETADIAFRASLTGHQVLSTLHTNNAPASINRLINMGVPPYLVTAAIRCVIAQKLLHRTCEKCKAEYRPFQKTVQRLKLSSSKMANSKFFKGTGCKECNLTGIYGRMGVYETMVINDSLRDIILDGGSEMLVKRMARLNGMKTMREIAILRSTEGFTTLEEVLYATPPDDDTNLFNLPTPQFHKPGAKFPGNLEARATEVVGQEQPSTPNFPTDDPIFKSILHKLEDDFFYFSEDELSKRFQLSLPQIQECLQMVDGQKTRERFKKKFGHFPEEMTEDEALELIHSVRGRQGRLPGFIFEQDESAGLFSRIMTSEALKTLAEKDANPERIPDSFSAEFCVEFGLEQALEWANQNRFLLVDLVHPNRYKAWQFGNTKDWISSGEIPDRAREALEWLMTVKLGCSRGDLPKMLYSEVFSETGLGILLEKFGGSVFKLVQSVYPGVFQPWQFPEEEAVLWFREDRYELAKTATTWLIENRMGINVDEIPQRIGLKDFHLNGLSKLLDLFNQNVFQIIDNAYPGKFKQWQYSEQTDLWQGTNSLNLAREATLWLIKEKLQWESKQAISQLTRRHFLNNNLGFMLGVIFNHSSFMALENAFIELKNSDVFQKALLQFSQEWRDHSTRWTSLAEKMAISQFGKSKFKVTLPNLKIAPIIPETDRIYYNSANQIEYVPQIIVSKISAYDDFSEAQYWVPYCDQLNFWILTDDRATGYNPPAHPKVKLHFSENLIGSLRSKGLLDVVEKVHSLKNSISNLLDRKAPPLF
ncbi:type II/IV secretion system protein, partial [bacterium]|nr:type II/IV secretion system protein [bacterium]